LCECNEGTLVKKPDRIRVLIADDHEVLREGLALLIDGAPDLHVVAQAADGGEAVEQFLAQRPDVALLDLRMPGMDGVQAIVAIRERVADARIVLLTAFEADEDVYRGFQAGARGYLLKSTSREELLNCICAVCGGEMWVPAAMAAKLALHAARPQLTQRQLEVLRLMAVGQSNKEIGAKLNVSEGTVKTHVNQILEKLGATGRTQAVTIAMERGITHSDDVAVTKG
jgi:two-component system, NarL family, response regulator